jgi:hypothetical protein
MLGRGRRHVRPALLGCISGLDGAAPIWTCSSEIVIELRPGCHARILQGVISGAQTGGDLLRSPLHVSHPGRVGPSGPTQCPPIPALHKLPRRGGCRGHRFEPAALNCHCRSTNPTSTRVRRTPTSPAVTPGGERSQRRPGRTDAFVGAPPPNTGPDPARAPEHFAQSSGPAGWCLLAVGIEPGASRVAGQRHPTHGGRQAVAGGVRGRPRGSDRAAANAVSARPRTGRDHGARRARVGGGHVRTGRAWLTARAGDYASGVRGGGARNRPG